MDAESRAMLAAAHTHAPGRIVPLDTTAPAGGPIGRGSGLPLAVVARSGPFGAAVVRTLRLALAPRRWELWNAYNDHRAYPSPQAAYVVDVALRIGTDRWAVDPVRDRLFGPPDRPDVPAPPDVVHLELTCCPERLPVSYGSLGEALAYLESGHVAAALVEAATAQGLATDCSTVDRQRGRTSVCVTITPVPGKDSPRSLVPTTTRRSAGLAPRGLTVDPRPLATAILPKLVRAGSDTPHGSPARWPGLRHTVAVRGITGFEDGVYAVSGAAPILRSPGNVMGEIQRAFTYPPSSIDVAGMNVAWVTTGAIAEAVRMTGPAAYHRLLVAAGATAQHIGTAAAATGLFCRPCRSVRETPLEAAIGAPADHDFLYLLLIGHSRLRDFPYDLTPQEA